MDDDFNTPQAIAVLFDLAREINRGHDEGLGIGETQKTLLELAEVLGLTLGEAAAPDSLVEPLRNLASRYGLNLAGLSDDVEEFIYVLAGKRAEFRQEKKWQLADATRSDLKELGITLEDTPQGTVWRYRKP
jgi:cysteinyl-tRNA synthetase